MNDVSLFPRKNVTLFQIKVTINKNDYVIIAIYRIFFSNNVILQWEILQGTHNEVNNQEQSISKYQN